MKFIFRQTINTPREVVFAFFRNPRCLRLLHVKEEHIRVLRHGADVRIGCETWVEVTMFGMLPVVLGFRHDVFDPPRRFGEVLFHGPFTKFTHVHEFLENGAQTEVVDYLDVELPWFYGGAASVRWLVWPGMKRSFEVRHEELSELIASGELQRRAEENLALLEAA